MHEHDGMRKIESRKHKKNSFDIRHFMRIARSIHRMSSFFKTTIRIKAKGIVMIKLIGIEVHLAFSCSFGTPEMSGYEMASLVLRPGFLKIHENRPTLLGRAWSDVSKVSASMHSLKWAQGGVNSEKPKSNSTENLIEVQNPKGSLL